MVENKLYRVTFSTQGAVVKSWVLKNYRDAKNQLLETINGPACETWVIPMSLSLANPALNAQVNQGIYVAKAEYGKSPLPGQEPGALRGLPFPSRHSDLHLQRRQDAGEEAVLLRPEYVAKVAG